MRNKYRGRGGTKATWHFLSIIIQAKALISGVSLLSLPLASAPWLASRQVHILWSSNHLRDSGLVTLSQLVPVWP